MELCRRRLVLQKTQGAEMPGNSTAIKSCLCAALFVGSVTCAMAQNGAAVNGPHATGLTGGAAAQPSISNGGPSNKAGAVTSGQIQTPPQPNCIHSQTPAISTTTSGVHPAC
jgi:hypothetical protein